MITTHPAQSSSTADKPIASQSQAFSIEQLNETKKLLGQEIAFVFSADLNRDCADSRRVVGEILLKENANGEVPKELPAHLKRMCDTSLLSADQEKALFKRMNFLKYQANSLRSSLDPSHVNRDSLSEIHRLLDEAEIIREHLVKANMRLVMSIVKKFVTRQHSFDDLLSEGTFTLIQAVEKFDYSRGFRFSTYAYRSIVRSVYRLISNSQREDDRVTLVAEDWPFESQADDNSSTLTDQVWSNLRQLTSEMLQNLDRRERMIIRCRYALGSHRKVTTFQALADKLGVSKERVRQLEQRAVSKLRAMASKYEADELFGASMV